MKLRGKKRRETICIAFTSEDTTQQDDEIRMNRCSRNNGRVRIGDNIQVHACADIQNANKIHVLPIADTIEGITGNIA